MKKIGLVLLCVLFFVVLLLAQTHTGAVLDVGPPNQSFTVGQSVPAYNLVQASGSPFTVLGYSGYYWNDTASAYTFQLDAPISGKQYCFGNYKARSSAVTVKSTTSVTIYYKGVAGTTGTSGTLVSSGAAGDFICLVGTDTTTYMAVGAGYGTWTNN